MAASKDTPEDDKGGVEDMISLSDLNEHSILKNLKSRYSHELIYTYTGSILVAVNPYKMFNIYGLDMVKRYEGQALGELAPHLFAVGSASYTKMLKDTENQVLVISGESGAGKTESTKLLMQYLAAVNKSGNNLITEQILEANPLLESFGNAKTIRNDNSSRFGKYIEVFFKSGAIVGAKTSEYLLEKSRIVTQAPEERNYHVFYEMLESLSDEQKAKYGLQTAPKYFYLNQGGSSLIPGRDDAGNYRKLTDAMEILRFERLEQDTIIKILASVLHIGNIYFKSVHENNHDKVQLGSEAEIKWISHLLELSDDWLKQALISKVTEARGDRVVSPYNLDQALDARDAIAKALYNRLFSWLVERINYIICRAEREKSTSLAVLDIFGFEDFHLNSFEQLCINYANETLQYFFNQHVFRLEQREYNKEKIQWEHIEFKDNQPTIDLIATKPAGILHILDDESNFPKATDQSFLEKCHFHHASNELYDKPRMSDPEFFIAHYAGKIKYNVLHFLEKNKDTLRSDVIELLCESDNEMISQMFKDLRDRNITKTLSKTTGRYVTLKPRTPTVAASFNESLLSLIDTMSRCNPYFVRCIKPNATKSPMVFEDIVVLDQLRYTGMLETIRIRRMGYPVRIKFPHFIDRYRCLLKGQKIKNSQVPWDVCKVILQTQGPDLKMEYQIGATKVFMKESFEMKMDIEARRIKNKAVTKLQTFIRMCLVYKRHRRIKKGALQIQRMVRMRKARRDFTAVRHGIILAQAQFRMRSQQRKYLKIREEIRQKLKEEKLARKKREAQERLEKEKREKQAQMMATIANLDIPTDLAYVFSKTADWELMHRSADIITAMGDVVPMDMGYKLPVDINSHAFSKYTSVYFKNPVWGVTMEPITTSLTPVQGDENHYQAVALFKLILRFMCDTNMNEKREKILSDFIINMALKNDSIRDEILCQLVNQAWLGQSKEKTERVWLLLINCLCCFNPSPTLFKYLLKFVSDVGIGNYNITAQHKILQSAYMDPKLSRVYPSTFLEWKAVQRKANMALEVTLPDGINVIGHVESWTSGELFTSHLLKLRGLNENSQGWTVMLQEDVDFYELMGYDYVLDLVSEIEVPPGLPACTAYFLVSIDRTKERLHHRQHFVHAESVHNPERDRVIVLTGPLPEMIKRDSSKTPAANTSHTLSQLYHQQQFHKGSNKLAHLLDTEDVGFSKTSILNQRPTEIVPSGLAENSKMNVRYVKRSRAPGPPNGHIPNGIANGHITTINEDDEDFSGNVSELSGNKLNGRYFPNVKTNDGTELSHSKLNQRYAKNSKAGKIDNNHRHKHLSRDDLVSVHSDMSQQVDDIFNNALKFHDEQDGRVLGSRIKGGGQGVPGLQTQHVPPLTQPLLGLGLQQPVVPPLNLNGLSSPLSPTDPLQQVAAQQMAQQQAILQAYLSQQQQQQQQQQAALLQASLQQHQQQQQQQAALQNSHQQTAALKTALQQQELQNKLLKQSIEQEVLRQQLQQVHLQAQVAASGLPLSPMNAVGPLSPESSFSSGMNMAGLGNSYLGNLPSTSGAGLSNGIVNGQVPTPTSAEPAGPRRVKFMKSAFEKNQSSQDQPMSPPMLSPRHSVQFDTRPYQLNTSSNVTKGITITSTTTTDFPVQDGLSPSSPPPPISFADGPSLHTQPSIPPTPPPPPPPPPVNFDIDKEQGTFTIRDKSGRARTIRIGKVVWPPPAEKKEEQIKRKKIQVGKLEIDEHVASEIESGLSGGLNKPKMKIISTKKDDKPTKSILRSEETEEQSTKFRRTKSLIETSHIHTLKLLEQKLGGGGGKVEDEVEAKAPLSLPHPSEINGQENIYNTSIQRDLPPPLPTSLPPPLPPTTKTVTTTETTETFETQQRLSGIYNTRIEADKKENNRESGLYSSRIEMDVVDAPAIAPPEPKLQIDYAAFERIITELYPQNKTFFLMYNKVPWTLHMRKEVFWPSEKLDNPTSVHLIYCQIVSDVYNNGMIRINRDQRVKMKSMLESYGVTTHNYLTKEIKPQIKKVIVDTVKEWPVYFSRLFPIAIGGHYSKVTHLGVSHTGLRLVTREKTIVDDQLNVMEEIRFEDVIDVILPSHTCLQLNLRTKSLIFHTTRAHQLKDMIDRFCAESERGNKFVVAVRDYITRESTLLSFKRGDIIKLMDPEMDLESGWLYGSLNGIVGLFPGEHVKTLARHEVEISAAKPVLYQPKSTPARQESHSHDDLSETSQGTMIADGKFSMMEFAMLHYRESLEKYEMLRTEDGSIRGTVKMIESVKLQNMKTKEPSRRGANDWSWKEQAELVKWTRSPIQASLLKLNSAELNKVALECFITIMRFMGDYPMGTNMNDFDCTKKILLSCHKYPALRDEVFCQLCKQTTNNRSMFHKSKIRGWRLFALVAAYYDCSEVLRPYLFKFLETTASDVIHTYNSAAALCLNNLRKTFRYGGRKDVPLKEEVVALADGRNCKRIPYYYPGITSQGGILQVKSCTVVQDAIEDICRDLNISDQVEMDEYTLFVRSGDGAYSKLKREDYILDIAAKYVRRQMHFDFIFQRTVWYFPIKASENPIYVDMFFHQVILDYIDGFLLVMPGGRLTNQMMSDVAMLGALLFKANNFHGVPTIKDLASILPGTLRVSPDSGRQQQWLNRIHDNLSQLGPMSSIKAKARFVDILKTWPLFGSTFFKIKRIPNVRGESLLAINKEGISFIGYDTHETIMHHSFSEILSTRRYRSDINVNYLDMKLGNLMVQQILRIETDQGSDISDLIGQYLLVINRHHKRQAKLMPNGHH